MTEVLLLRSTQNGVLTAHSQHPQNIEGTPDTLKALIHTTYVHSNEDVSNTIQTVR